MPYTTAMQYLRLTLVMLCAAGVLASLGCRREFTTEADRLRAKVVDLETSMEQLERRNAELQSQIHALQRRPDEVSPEVVEATPRVTSIAIGRLSHVRDRDGDGVPDTAVVYVNVKDGEGRFVHLVGNLTVQAALLREDAEPVVLGRRRLSPGELRATYRYSFAGIHYTVDVPVTWSEDHDRPESITIQADYTDGYTGEQYTAQATARVRWR